jgi:hypothetical protein
MAEKEKDDPEEPSSPSGVSEEITSFVHNIDGLQVSLPALTVMSLGILIACLRNHDELVSKHGTKTSAEGGPETFAIGPEHSFSLARLVANLKKAEAGFRLLPQNYLVALVSQYDAFLGELLRRLYLARPDHIKQSSKQLTYAQLFEYKTLEDAKQQIVEKEIEDLLRESHAAQFDLLESRFDLKLRTELPVWPVFIELTERRNLFVHAQGRVSVQYLAVCKRHSVNHETPPNPGDVLDVKPEYFNRAHACVYEIGVKLGHVLWRKFLPEEREAADSDLVDQIYNLVVAKRYDLAITLGNFALMPPIKKPSTESTWRAHVINLAQAHKWKGNKTQAETILDGYDWSSCANEFKICVAVLKDDFDQAAALMKRIGPDGRPTKHEYREWPVFREFIRSPLFLDTYRGIFGHDLEPIVRTPLEEYFSRPEMPSAFTPAKTTEQTPS